MERDGDILKGRLDCGEKERNEVLIEFSFLAPHRVYFHSDFREEAERFLGIL